MKSFAKLICLALLLQFSLPNSYSQPKLWSTLPTNGTTESGSVYQIELDGTGYTSIKDFVFPNCGNPITNLLYADNGMVYGTAEGGFGPFGSVIYEYDLVDDSFEFAYSFFDSETGLSLSALSTDLMQHSNGMVYGMTSNGGDHYGGMLFEFNLETREMNYKVHFESTTMGEKPIGKLTEAIDGRLYGVTSQGGIHGLGVLFVYDPSTNLFAVLKHFDGTAIGARPINGPIQAPDGKLLGLTRSGGTADLGIIYEYDIGSNVLTKKHDFDGLSTGSNPEDRFCLSNNGMFYATTVLGGNDNSGTLIEFDQSTGTVSKILDFSGPNGRHPTGQLVQHNDGYLYGMTSHGGLEDEGALFKYDPVNSIYTKLFDFYDEYGESAYESLTITPEGKLMGTTWLGGRLNQGVIFEFTPSTAIYKVLVNFRYSETGGLPRCNLIEASDGLVYGTTVSGGVNSSGTIFRIDPKDRSFEKVFDFEYQNLGGGCDRGLMEASNGLLYGLASHGGSNNNGVLFAFNPSTLQYTVLFHFDQTLSGNSPIGKLIQGSNGSLYGVTERGGVNDAGVLFEYMLSSHTYLILHEFDDAISGRYPTGVIQAANGNLYGTTSRGGTYNNGVLFEFNPSTYAMNTPVEFDNLNKGAYPVDILLEFDDNQLYGLTGHGGSDGSGVLYHFDATNGVYTKLKNFQYNDDGYSPFGGLMKASNDLIYGTTSMGGAQEWGVVFSYNPTNGDYDVVHEFSQYADRPLYGSFLELSSEFAVEDIGYEELLLDLYPNPATSRLSLSCDGINGSIDLVITDICGKIVLKESHVHHGIDTYHLNLDVENYDAGVYILQLISEENTLSGKFVKAK